MRLHGAENGPFTRLAVVKDPALTASLKDTGVSRTVCGGEETYVVLDNASYPWEPEERAAAGLPSEPELRDMFVEKVRASAACARAPAGTPRSTEVAGSPLRPHGDPRTGIIDTHGS